MVEDFSRNLTSVPADVEIVSKGRNIVTVIGIDNYVNWPKLRNAVSDSMGIQKLFVEKLGFISPTPPLLNSDATQKNLMSLVQDQLHNVLEPDDTLLIFFAGHGHTRENKVCGKTTETGYIIPFDAQIDHWSDYIKIESFLEDVSQLPARHILVVLDACRSGFALGNYVMSFRSRESYEKDMLNHVSRKVITSARRDEDALDSGPVEGHSLFTGSLIDGINWGKADLDFNGLVTSSELGLFLQQWVGQTSESKQTPDFGPFHLDDRGEMVISLADDTFDSIKTRAFTALRRGDRTQFKELVDKVVDLHPQSPEALYLQYRLHLANGNIDNAIDMVHILQKLNLSKGMVPLSGLDLEELEVQLKFWKPILLIPGGDLPIEVTMLTGPDEEHLEEAPQKTIGGRLEYLIKRENLARFRVKNLTQSPAHIYYIDITRSGRILIGPLLEDDESRIEGLKPGAEGQGSPFFVRDAPGLNETHLFYSPKRVSKMLFPVNILTMLSLGTISTEETDNLNGNSFEQIRMKPFWYRIMGKRYYNDPDFFS